MRRGLLVKIKSTRRCGTLRLRLIACAANLATTAIVSGESQCASTAALVFADCSRAASIIGRRTASFAAANTAGGIAAISAATSPGAVEALGVDQLVDQAAGERILGQPGAAGADDGGEMLRGRGEADDLQHQAGNTTPTRHFRQADAGRAASQQPLIARQHEDGAAGDRMAVDGRDQRLGERRQPLERPQHEWDEPVNVVGAASTSASKSTPAPNTFP